MHTIFKYWDQLIVKIAEQYVIQQQRYKIPFFSKVDKIYLGHYDIKVTICRCTVGK